MSSSPDVLLSNPSIVLPLPVLSEVPLGEYSLTVPINDSKIQVGSRRTPDSFDSLKLVVTEGEMQIARAGGDLQIESGVMHKGDHGKQSSTRVDVLIKPEPTLKLTEVDGHWVTEAGNVASRLGMVRFAAKVGEAAIRKSSRAQLQNR